MRASSYLKTVVALALAVSAGACGVNRDAADRKIAKACIAAVETVATDPDDTIEVQNETFSSIQSAEGTDLRVVVIDVYYTKNRGVIEEETFTCAFEESRMLGNYQARFYHMEALGWKIGKFDDTFHGDLNDMMKIDRVTTPVLLGQE